ncbi:MAG: hypothetical protein ABIO16_16200 [Nocardioides sp.]
MNSSHRRSGSRSAAALVLGLTLAGGLAACGDDSADNTASDPAASSSTPSPSETTPTEPGPTDDPTETPSVPESGSGAQETIPATGSAGVTEASLISATEGGGASSDLAFALDTDQARADFAAQFDGGFADTVSISASEVAQQAGDGSTVYGATVAVGCDAPRSVSIDLGEAGLEIVATFPKSNVQCLAPVTYVVLFAVPDA